MSLTQAVVAEVEQVYLIIQVLVLRFQDQEVLEVQVVVV
jgi:hypothetical protein